MSTKAIYFIDFRGIISEDKDDIVKRHIKYAEGINNVKNIFVIVLSSSKKGKIKTETPNYFRIESLGTGFKIFRYIYKSLQIIKVNGNRDIGFVCGDSNESLAIALILKLFLGIVDSSKIKIQTQIHSDLFNPGWRGISLTKNLRFITSHILITFSNQIRMVGIQQSKYLIRSRPKLTNKIFVAPVPINANKKFSTIGREKTGIRLGFLGRLEKERGTDELLEFAKIWLTMSEEHFISIAGTGKQVDKISHSLKNSIISGKVKLWGELSTENLNVFWRDLSGTIFFAKQESFGRAMWESLYNGVIVYSRPNSGAIDLEKLLDADGIILFDNIKTLIDKIDEPKHVQIRFSTAQNYLDETYHLLIKKWVELT